MRESLEYAAAWIGLKALGLLPRSAARQVGAAFAALTYQVRTPLKRAAIFNLQLAFPDMSEAERERIIRGMIRQIGWMAGEFSQFPKFSATNISQIVSVDGAKISSALSAVGKGSCFSPGT
jgi:KDO2-lipid IV(A) lauroyltransferase